MQYMYSNAYKMSSTASMRDISRTFQYSRKCYLAEKIDRINRNVLDMHFINRYKCSALVYPRLVFNLIDLLFICIIYK
jgi:hypothetical protein